MTKQIVVRFPPSPTGQIHIGNMRTMLFNFLFAKKNNGKVVFRFEDTDAERSKQEFEQPMLDAYKNFGLSWDDGPFKQSERAEIYNKYLKLLVDADLAYEAEINKFDNKKVIRLRNPERNIVWDDLVRGEIKINTHTFKGRDEDGNFDENGNPDIIIARNLNDAVYHFTVVIDDWLMGVTHVIRGEEHITSTPRQIMIMEALRDLKLSGEPEVQIPLYAHLPIIVGADKKKLSKRNGNTALQMYLDAGYLKETLANYLAFLGWNPGDEREFFTMEELIQEFSLEKCQKSPAQFDILKLDHINKHYLSKLSETEFIEYCLKYFTDEERELINSNFETNKKVFLKVLRDRTSNASDVFNAYRNGDTNMFFKFLYNQDLENFDKHKFCFKNKDGEQTLHEVQANMKMVVEKIAHISEENWTAENLKAEIWDWSATVGRGQILHPLRMIMSLKDKSPDPFTIMDIIGKAESLRRLDLDF